MTGSHSPLRERARDLLCQANTFGRLETALEQPGRFAAADDEVLEEPASPHESSSKQRSRKESCESMHSEPFHRHKKPAHDLSAALALGAPHIVEVDLPHSPHSPHTPSPEMIAHLEAEEKRREKEDAQSREKFAEAERQRIIREDKLALYKKRMEFCDRQLKPLLDKLVAGVSADTERPENPVPMLMELLAEHTGQNLRNFKNVGPESKCRREIKELQKEIKGLRKELANDTSPASPVSHGAFDTPKAGTPSAIAMSAHFPEADERVTSA